MSNPVPIESGKAVVLGDRLIRVTAPNPSMMTGDGTNTYIVGCAAKKDKEATAVQGGDCVVIDPGPAIESHIDAIVEIVGNSLRAILVTHTHNDHSPAAMLLKQRFADMGIDVPCMGMPSEKPEERRFQDASFVADRVLKHGDVLSFSGSPSGGFHLEVIYTPGHVSNHLCYLLREGQVLVAGDHMMQGSTVAIVPPQGDMLDYLNSLKRLKDYAIAVIAPAHGMLMLEPLKEIDSVIRHRLWREKKILQFIAVDKAIETTDLLLSVYDDVDPQLHWAAKFSLVAHLAKLLREQRVGCNVDLSGLTLETMGRLDNAKWQQID